MTVTERNFCKVFFLHLPSVVPLKVPQICWNLNATRSETPFLFDRDATAFLVCVTIVEAKTL